MAVSRKIERELIRTNFLEKVAQFLYEGGEEVLRVKSNEIAIPVVGCEGNEDFLVINFKVPTGANKGLEPYDGYAIAEDYVHNLAEKERKAEERKAEKAKKIARDAEIRKRRAEIHDKQLSVKWGVNSPFYLSVKCPINSYRQVAARVVCRTYVRVRSGSARADCQIFNKVKFSLDKLICIWYNKSGAAKFRTYVR